MDNAEIEIEIPYKEEFIDYLEIELNRSENTISAYIADLRTFFYFLDHVEAENEVEKITKLQIRRYMTYQKRERGNTATSIKRRLASLRAYLEFLVKNDVLTFNSAQEIATPKSKDKIPYFWSEQETEMIFKQMGEERAIYEVMYSTMCRVSEVRELNLEDVDFENLSITIRSGKGGKDRVVYLTNRAKRHLVDYIKTTRTHLINKAKQKGKSISEDTKRAVFLSTRIQRISTRAIQKKLQDVLQGLGLNGSCHTFRHTGASHLVMHQANLRVVQELLGHASLSTTQIYANMTDNFKRKEFDSKMGIK